MKKVKSMRFLALALAAITLVSCNRDPNYLKQKYLESGNKYFDAGRFKEAALMYRRAIEKDRKFGEGYYKLALADLKAGQPGAAIPALQRAVELLKTGTPDSDDATLKLSEFMVLQAQVNEHNERLVKDISDYAAGMLKRSPNSWQGHKISGDLAMLDTMSKYKQGRMAEAKQALSSAISEYRTALAAKPGDYVITLAVARTLVLNGEIPEAEGLFKSLLDKDKKNLNGFYDLYRLYVGLQRFPEAEKVLNSAISNNPKDPALRLELARFYFVTHNNDALLALLKQMKSNLKDFPQAYMQAGDFYIRVNQFDEALKQYEEGIQKDPKQKISYLKHEIEAYVRQNNLAVAKAKNDEILKQDPKDPEARGLRATFLLDKGEVTAAMTELQSVVTAKPNNFVARFNLGRAHFASGQYEQARQEFDKAIELRPDYLPARLAQTQVALLRGDLEAANRYADETMKIAPASIEARVMKAAALQRQQKFDEARALLMPVIEKNPTQVEALLELAVLDLNQKKNKEAIEFFGRAYQAAPGNIRGLLGMSRAYLSDGQPEKSVEVVRTEALKYPDHLDLVRELGNAQMAAGRFDEAISSYQNVLGKTKDPRLQSDAWGRIAQAHRFKGDMQHAVEALEKSRQGVPENTNVLTTLAMLYEVIGRNDIARKTYELAIKADRNNAYALNNLAYLISESNGDLNEALTYAQTAKQKLPNFTEITDTLGWIYLKKNLTDSAIDNFKTLVVQAPQNPVYHYHYAMALNQKGDRDTARKECQAALANKPNKSQENDIRQLMSKLG
jgi:tetratricopeptide (TPR) repeat protein